MHLQSPRAYAKGHAAHGEDSRSSNLISTPQPHLCFSQPDMSSSVLGGCLVSLHQALRRRAACADPNALPLQLRCARRTSPPSTSARLASFAPLTSTALARSSRPYSTSSAVRSTWNTSRRHFSAPPPSGPPPPQPLPTGDRPPPLTREQYQREQLLRAKELQDRYYKKNKHQAANIGLYMTAVVRPLLTDRGAFQSTGGGLPSLRTG